MSNTTLKITALIFMLIDHIATFIPNIPVWFHWIGRLSAPLFFFCMVWGFYYTRNRKKYLIRMYLFGSGMAVINLTINYFQNDVYIANNIFITIFIICTIIMIIDKYYESSVKGKKYIFIFLIIQILGTILFVLIELGRFSFFSMFFGSVFANIFTTEGGVPFIILGILLYYVKNSKRKLMISYVGFCVVYSILYCTNIVARILIRLENILSDSLYMIINNSIRLIGTPTFPIYGIRFFELTDYSWMIIFALPLMLLYNGEKGRGYKYFFYYFYPVHIYIMVFIGLAIHSLN